MNQHRRKIVADCLDRLGDGNLTADELRHAFEQFAEAPRRQDLLYIQANESALHSDVIGMKMLVDGEYVDEPGPAGPKPSAEDGWPYTTVIDAINDGWRVISFPNMALSLDENRTYGLGFEFILERWP